MNNNIKVPYYILENECKNNPIKHPNHYNWVPEVEAMDVAKYFGFCLGNVIKYVWRVPHKSRCSDYSGALEDLYKARYYLDIEIEKLKDYINED